MKKIKSFTLAEVLITLVVIGIVAAITIGALYKINQERIMVTKLAATYSVLLDGFKIMVQQNGTIDTYGSGTERVNTIIKLLPQYIKMTECKKWRDCLSSEYKFRNSTVNRSPDEYYHYSLLNGAVISIKKYNNLKCVQNMAMNQKGTNEYNTPGSSIYYGTYNHSCGELEVDINGPAPPNKSDVDLFKFKLVTDGIVPAGSSKETIWTDTFDRQCKISAPLGTRTYGYCTGWVLANKNMDYLHCPDELGWNKKTSCK